MTGVPSGRAGVTLGEFTLPIAAASVQGAKQMQPRRPRRAATRNSLRLTPENNAFASQPLSPRGQWLLISAFDGLLSSVSQASLFPRRQSQPDRFHRGRDMLQLLRRLARILSLLIVVTVTASATAAPKDGRYLYVVCPGI